MATVLNEQMVEIGIVSSVLERQDIYKLRYQVLVNEMGKNLNSADHNREIIVDDLDDTALLIYAKQENKLIASLRINIGPFEVDMNTNFALEKFSNFKPDELSYFSHMVVDSNWWGTTILGRLLVLGFQELKNKGVKFCFIKSTPFMVQFYENMGFRRYKENYNDPDFGYLIPMILVMEDVEHLRTVSSPFAGIAAKGQIFSQTPVWFKNNFPQLLGVTNERALPIEDFWKFLATKLHESGTHLLNNLTEEEQKKFLSYGFILKAGTNDRIVRKGDHGNEMYVILSGAVDIRGTVDGKETSLSILGNGNVFGEMGFLSKMERSADALALTDCEIIVLTQESIQKVMSEIPRITNKILFNLSLILCERLRSANLSLVEKSVIKES